ncbi:Holliday junction branch migration protein RuvA [Caldicellulosiruptor naganoensis]|uniref:Holliday junction branch migration complex subunit RuvA n=1 Tax=Caldicellulosiruptor naganoensis TaxID=29324 RepID=A0ABY7BDM8_9FIRM|nr:Holliday junction branch migration protein RuvA [Caldicellulosiruptor naganoensis]WAM30925.1 Holliday junction branch migration protein RuvA [Caldicellulosiruptor naganoensis]
MIDSIVGVIEEIQNNFILLNYKNVILKIFCNTSQFFGLIGQEKRIYVHIKFNESLSELECYGFLTKEERELFLKLQRVSGIGAKLALQIISTIPYEELIIEIAKGNSSRLEKVKGIGKKTASRIILELKETLKKEFKIESSQAIKKEDSKLEEISLALLSLGYEMDEINEVLSSEDFSSLSIEDGIKEALRRLSRL